MVEGRPWLGILVAVGVDVGTMVSVGVNVGSVFGAVVFVGVGVFVGLG